MGERLIATNGIKLWSEDFGDAADPTVLLIAGANTSAFGWPNEFVELLADSGRHVIRYDHRDTGRSTWQDRARSPRSLQEVAADAVAVLDGWGAPRAHVVGFSLGCTIGQVLALDHPDRLLTLSLLAGAALDVDLAESTRCAHSGEPTPTGLPAPRREILDLWADRATPARSAEDELDRRIAELRVLAGDALPFDEAEFRLWEQRSTAHAGTTSQPSAHGHDAPVPTSRAAELAGVSTPTLVVQAPLDPINPPPHGRHLADLIPGARLLEVPGMGHALSGAVHGPLVAALLTHTA
ncbi:alpha/beta fold hydrolase [Umezawaea beigongshangensis]|uniref:alpha/beta fold hydrolase n=1 Tax=Umezawaea beigongshangensis TaxID=2780383 RepID=UPI0018F265A8|nr:alpha/beta hydrolase [Umezawaea beigongshangensis]